ncbi:MAG: amidohydrolase [Microbacteriaceae bacterium]|nr:amidohydrolase [Microbacteriaceae bacterium]
MIDAAVHVWSSDTAAYPWPPDAAAAPPTSPAGPEALFADLSTAGVTGAVAVQSSAYGDNHAFLLDTVRASGGALAAVGLVRSRGMDAADQARDLVRSGCAGLRVVVSGDPAWLESPAADAVWSLAEGHRVPVGFLARPDELPDVAALAARRPDLRVVVDHLGLIEPAALDSSRPALELLARSPNTSIKVSALRALAAAPPPFAALRPLLLTVRDLFGYERMAYGTDWPYAVEQDSYPATLEALDAVFDWDPAERERVTEGTARSLWWREHRS